jgi:uncharacterized protein
VNEPQVCNFALISRPVTLAVTPPNVYGRQDSRVEVYRHKSAILKQIMSNKARRYRRINAAQNITTVVASALLLFFGFSGLPKVQTWVSWVYPISLEATEFGFNLLVFLLFVLGVLHLVFHFPEKQSRAEKAIASLAALVNEIEDMITTRGNLVISEDASKIALIGTRYEAAAEGIPANSDKEYQKAKADLANKETRRAQIHLSAQLLFDKAEHERIVSAIALGSRPIVDALLTLRSTSSSLYLGGGLIRNAVWDHLHGYDSPTAIDDVDVIYFDQARTDKRHDKDFDNTLADKTPNVRWSTKNQARMHVGNCEQPYASLEHAVSRWPETATATVVRLKDDGTLEFVAPFGFDDLLRMIVTNTPAFVGREEIIRERLRQKRWTETWPLLKIWLASPLSPTNAIAPVPNSRKSKKGLVRRLLHRD